MDVPDPSATPVCAGVINQSPLPRAVIGRISASGPADAPTQNVDIDTQVVQESEQLDHCKTRAARRAAGHGASNERYRP